MSDHNTGIDTSSSGLLSGISELKAQLADLNALDIAEIFNELSRNDIIKVFRILPKSIAAEVFASAESDQQRIIVEA